MQQGDLIQTAKLLASVDPVSNGHFPFRGSSGWNQR
jgi:hypothetical protein